MKDGDNNTTETDALTEPKKTIKKQKKNENPVCMHWNKENLICTCAESSQYFQKCLVVGVCKLFKGKDK
jgi:hypothetical protein